MTNALALVRRTRRHVRSADDFGLLVRVVAVLVSLPVLIRLPWLSLLRGLELVSRVAAVPPGPRADRVDFYVRACGALRWGPFQDNCFARALTRFALLNHDTRPLDVALGVAAAGPVASRPGRRHVWLTIGDGTPLLEPEPVDGYVAQVRYRQAAAARGPAGLGRFIVLLGASGIAAAALAAASVARTKIVAVLVGPAGLALVGQMAAAVAALGWLAAFGSAGTARYLAEALGRDRRTDAATVARTATTLLVGGSVVIVVLGLVARERLAILLFGDPSAVAWVSWLLAAVPLAATTSVASALLRGTQRVARLAAAQGAAALASVMACLLLAWPGEARLVVFVPLAVVGSLSVAVATAAWPVWRRWLSAGGRWLAGGLARSIAAYGVANLASGLSAVVALLAIGRHYLAAGDLETAGRIAALALFGEPLVATLVSGQHATTYPAYVAAPAGAAAAVLARGVRGVVLLAAPALAVASFAAPVLVTVAFSREFGDIAALVSLQVLSTYLRSSNVVLGLPLLARGRLVPLAVLHMGWATALAVGALAWAGPSTSGPEAFVQASAVAAAGQFVALLALLRAYRLEPAARDVLWLLGGAVPLAALAVWR